MLPWLISTFGYDASTIIKFLMMTTVTLGAVPMLYLIGTSMVKKPVSDLMDGIILSWCIFWFVGFVLVFVLLTSNAPTYPRYWNAEWKELCFSLKYDTMNKNPQIWNDYCKPALDLGIATEIWDKTGINPLEGK